MHSLLTRSLSQAASPLFFYPVKLKNFPMEIISNAENLKSEHRRLLPNRTAMCTIVLVSFYVLYTYVHMSMP